jgi:hypothetical protein
LQEVAFKASCSTAGNKGFNTNSLAQLPLYTFHAEVLPPNLHERPELRLQEPLHFREVFILRFFARLQGNVSASCTRKLHHIQHLQFQEAIAPIIQALEKVVDVPSVANSMAAAPEVFVAALARVLCVQEAIPSTLKIAKEGPEHKLEVGDLSNCLSIQVL